MKIHNVLKAILTATVILPTAWAQADDFKIKWRVIPIQLNEEGPRPRSNPETKAEIQKDDVPNGDPIEGQVFLESEKRSNGQKFYKLRSDPKLEEILKIALDLNDVGDKSVRILKAIAGYCDAQFSKNKEITFITKATSIRAVSSGHKMLPRIQTFEVKGCREKMPSTCIRDERYEDFDELTRYVPEGYFEGPSINNNLSICLDDLAANPMPKQVNGEGSLDKAGHSQR